MQEEPNSVKAGKPLFHYAAWVTLHAALFLLLLTGYRIATDKPASRTNAELLSMDADLYHKIVVHGAYDYESDNGIVAFFPGFPYLWKWTGLSVQGITILNILIFIFGLSWLAYMYRFTVHEVILSASLPSMMFMFVPFSEALFFIEFTLLLFGLKKNNLWVAALGIFLCSVTRSSANVFVPALILMTLVSDQKNRWWRGLLYIITSIAGVLLVALIQYVQTGQVFGFVKAQARWGHRLQWPHIPFSTWGNVLWLDGFALVCGLFAVAAAIIWFYNWLKSRDSFTIAEPLAFSAAYLAGLVAISLAMKGGSLFSLNRYLIPGAAFVLCLVHFIRIKWTREELIRLAVAVFFFMGLVHAFRHILVILESIGMQLYLMLFLLYNNSRYRRLIFSVLYITGLIIQVCLADMLSRFIWVA